MVHRSTEQVCIDLNIKGSSTYLCKAVGNRHPKSGTLRASGNIAPEKPFHHLFLCKVKFLLNDPPKMVHRSTNKRPRIPKSLINRYREGLIIGSACEAGELFRAILHGRGHEKIKKIVDFYDYLEIQPLGNDKFMINNSKYPVNSIEDIMEINRTIVRLGEEYHKPVVATCDVHFLNPEDSVYRSIIMKSKGFADANEQPPLYFS